jgi:hypothetical protein
MGECGMIIERVMWKANGEMEEYVKQFIILLRSSTGRKVSVRCW